MAHGSTFEDLVIWQQSRLLAKAVYDATRGTAFSNDRRLVSQIRAAAVSVMSNIAEGHDRTGSRELRHFLAMAKASCAEVRSQLYVAVDQGYVSAESAEQMQDAARKLSVGIARFIKGVGRR